MTTTTLDAPHWSTSAFGDSAEITPNELSGLGHHLSLCRALQGRWFAAQCVLDAVHAFLAARLVTSVMSVVLLVGVGSLAF